MRLEGWSGEIEELGAAVVRLAGDAVPSDDDTTFPRNQWWSWPDPGTVLEAAVVPSSLPEILAGSTTYAALGGVGIAWVGAADADEVAAVRRRVETIGGIAPAVRGPVAWAARSPSPPCTTV